MRVDLAEKYWKIILDGCTDPFREDILRYRTSKNTRFRWDSGYEFWFTMVPESSIEEVMDEVEKAFPALRVSYGS